MQKLVKKISLLAVFIIVMAVFAGCDGIFVKTIDPTQISEYSDDELSLDTYYVKNNTNFYEPYMPLGTTSGYSSSVQSGRLLWFISGSNKEMLVPKQYKGEIIAYASKYADFDSVTLERFIDKDYTIGIYGGELKTDGYYYMNANQNTCEGSSAASIFSNLISDEIRIASINGNAITKDMIDTSNGCFLGMTQDKTYKITFFAGTYYYEKEVTADVHLLQSYEMYNYGKEHIKDTYNGYQCFNMPELNSGWYWINGRGLFRYYNYDDEFAYNDAETDMNEPYYKTEEDLINAYSQQYSFVLDKRTKDLNITLQYDKSSIITTDEAALVAYVYGPDRFRYTCVHNEEMNTFTFDLEEAMQGKWTINIIPRTLVLTDKSVSSSQEIAELTLYEETLLLEEAQTDIAFVIKYRGKGTFNASLVAPDGLTYNMTDVTNYTSNGTNYILLSYSFPYAAQGEYRIKAYHYPYETTIEEVYTTDISELDSDIIIVED